MLNEKEFLRLISDSIRKRRLAGKISSEKLSELSGMDYSSINLIENQKQIRAPTRCTNCFSLWTLILPKI